MRPVPPGFITDWVDINTKQLARRFGLVAGDVVGCGWNGCVYSTTHVDGRVVKVTSDSVERDSAAEVVGLRGGYSKKPVNLRGIVHYHGIYTDTGDDAISVIVMERLAPLRRGTALYELLSNMDAMWNAPAFPPQLTAKPRLRSMLRTLSYLIQRGYIVSDVKVENMGIRRQASREVVLFDAVLLLES